MTNISELSIDKTAAGRRNSIVTADTGASGLVARLFPGVDNLAVLRRVELDKSLLSPSYAYSSTHSTTTPA